MRRVLVGLVILVLLVAGAGAAFTLISGDGSDDADDGDPPTHVPSPSATPGALPPSGPKLAAYYDQQVDWQPCDDDDDNECATMEVPLDYAHPKGETIQLALLKVPAREPDVKVGSLVVNPGGPGSPGTSYAAAGDSYWGDALLDHFDIVGFDPRGTGDSTSVDCLTDEQLDDYLASDPVPDSPAELAEFDSLARTFGKGCVTNSGALAAHVSTVEAVRDMDVLRAVLGEPRLDFFGASYGTKLGATYAQIFPKRIGRMVLDGAMDLSLDRRDTAIQQAAGFETALRAYVGNCVDSGECFLGDSVDAGLVRIQQFLADLDTTPLPAQDDRKLTAGTAYYGMAAPLYERQLWNVLSLSLRQAFGGRRHDVALARRQLRQSQSRWHLRQQPPGGQLGHQLPGRPLLDPDLEGRERDPGLREGVTDLRRSLRLPVGQLLRLHARSTVPVPHNKARGAPPLLVIGTTRDPATPLRWAVALADQLSSAVLVTRDGDGHTGYHSENACVDATVENYLVDGTVPSADVDCPAS